MRKLKILVRYEHGLSRTPTPTSYIRLLLPLGHPVNDGAFEVVSGYEGIQPGVDIVIAERIWEPFISPRLAVELLEQVRRAGACLIYSLDDNLLDLHYLTIEQRAAIAMMAREADGIIVSTAALKERLRELNSNVHVVANAVDERLFGPAIGRQRSPGKCNGRQVIGYMGTFTHDADLMLIGKALRSVLRKRRNEVELQFIGAVEQDSTLEYFRDLPVRVLKGVESGYAEYPQFVRWMIENMFFDVGIAPLQESAFTTCKSDIKFLDYSALGIPGIYSSIPIYRQTVRHLQTGYLAENSTEAWEEGLNRMLDDQPLRESIAKSAQEHVFSARTLEHRACDWQIAVQNIWETYSARKSEPNPIAAGGREGLEYCMNEGSGKSTDPDVDLILGVYNQPHLAVNCIESILANTNYPRWRLLIIDDHSDETTCAALEKYAAEYANIEVHRNEKNLGFGGTYNRGISLSTGKYLVLMNSDIVVPPRWLERLVEAAEADPSVALVNPLSNEVAQLSLPMAPGASFLAMDEMLSRRADNTAFDIVPAAGYCLLIRREALDRHGALDEVYGRGYYEDTDLHMRLTGNGWRSVAAPNVYVYHLNWGSFSSAGAIEQSQKNHAIFRQRWGARYDDEICKFWAANPLGRIRALFQTEPIPRQPLADLGKKCKKAIGVIVKNRGKLLSAVFQPRRAMAALGRRLRAHSLLVNTPAMPAPQPLELKATRRYLDQHTRHDLPSVVFVLEELKTYGSMRIIELANQLLLLGVEARVAAVNRKLVDPECLRGAFFTPMCFDGPQDLIRNFPHCDVAVATLWSTAPHVRTLVSAKRAGTAVNYLQDSDVWFSDDKKTQRQISATYALIEHRIATSNWCRDLMAEHGFDAKVIPLGIDVLQFYPRLREERSNMCVIAAARQETPGRGFEDVVEALRLVHKQRPHAEIRLYGDLPHCGSKNFGFPYKDMGIVKDRKELCRQYNESDIYLDTGPIQASALPALEAMACQVACVLANYGGVNQYAIDGVNALLVPAHNPKDCSRAILRLVCERELRMRIGREGRKTAENMPLKAEAEAWLDYLAAICPSFRRASPQGRKFQAAA